MHRALLWRTGGRSLFADTRVSRLHYYDIAGSGPLGTVVMFHGASQGAVHYGRVMVALLRCYSRIIAVDAPGHGLSGAPPQMNADVLADGVTELLDEVLGRSSSVVFGTSLGGAMALKYALARPERVSSVCVLSPAGAPLSERERDALMRTFEMRRHKDATAFMRLVTHRPSMLAPLVAVETRRRFRSAPMRQLFDSFVTGESELSGGEIRGLVPPVRLLWGRRERVLPPSSLAFFRQHLPVARRVIVEPPHFAHAAFLEFPTEVAGHIALSGQAAASWSERRRAAESRLDPLSEGRRVVDIRSHRMSNRPAERVANTEREPQAGNGELA